MEITTKILLYIGLLGFILGFVANKTNFCTMGAISDWINIGNMDRFRSWMLASAIAILGVTILEFVEFINLNESRIPYRNSIFFWPRYIVGGLMFGIGMTLTSGCGNKVLIRFGAGNLKSLVVIFIAGSMAYIMTRTDFYAIFFHSWMLPLSPDLGKIGIENQSITSIFSYFVLDGNEPVFDLIIGLIFFLSIFIFVVKSKSFLTNFNNLLSGVTVGLVVVLAWLTTGGGLGHEWIETVQFMDNPLPGVGVQSFTFINPMGETILFLGNKADYYYLTFGVTALLSTILGSFIYAISSKNFRFEWFASKDDFIRHLIGAILIGVGGVLSLGCTIGQGVSGLSTLALGSFLALGSIILGAAITMKIEYYRAVYDESAFVDCLKSSLADLKIIPDTFRTLDKI